MGCNDLELSQQNNAALFLFSPKKYTDIALFVLNFKILVYLSYYKPVMFGETIVPRLLFQCLPKNLKFFWHNDTYDLESFWNLEIGHKLKLENGPTKRKNWKRKKKFCILNTYNSNSQYCQLPNPKSMLYLFCHCKQHLSVLE